MNIFDILLKKNNEADVNYLYQVVDMYIGNLIFREKVGRNYLNHYLKTCLFQEDECCDFTDIETDNVYYEEDKYFDEDEIGVDMNSLTRVITYFSKNHIPYEEEMTEKEMLDLIFPERVGVFRMEELYVGTLEGLLIDKKSSQFKPLKKGIFLKKVFNDKTIYIDIETNKDYVDTAKNEGDLIFNSKTAVPLKKYFLENGIIYEEIMDKDDILNKYNETLNNSSLDYTSGINIEEDSIIQIEMCGSKNELVEALKQINKHNIETKIISNKPIERVKK